MEILEITTLITAIFLAFFSQTVLGFSGSPIALPILLLGHDLAISVITLSVLQFLQSTYLSQKHWKEIDKKVVLEIIVWVMLGVIIGIFFLKSWDPVILKKILGVLILLFVAYSSFKKKRIAIFKKMGAFFGFLAGIFSGVFSIGGPIFVTYFYSKIEDHKIMRASLLGVIALMATLRMPILAYNNLLTHEVWLRVLIAFPFFALSIFLGQKFFKKIDKEIFNKLVLTFMFLAGISLLY